MADLHPGSWIGDSVEEFKKLPTWGKIAAVVAVVAAAGLGYYEYQKSQAGAATSATTANSAIDSGLLGQGTILPPTTTDMSGASNNPPIVQPPPINPPPMPPVIAPGPSGGVNPPAAQPCPPGMHRGATSGECKCDAPNMQNMGTHCVPKTKPPMKKGGTGGGPSGDTMHPMPPVKAGPGPVAYPGGRPGGPPRMPPVTPGHLRPMPPVRYGPPRPKLPTHTVQRGETIQGIAARMRYPGGWQALALANGGWQIQEGQILQV